MSDREIRRILAACDETRYPHRNRSIVLLACEGGLTPAEISWLRRYSVATDDGIVGSYIDLTGKPGSRLKSRRVPLAPKGLLRRTIIATLSRHPGKPSDPFIVSERAMEGDGEGTPPASSVLCPMRPSSIGYVFWKLAEKSGVRMSGGRDARKTFIVRVGRAIRDAGGGARDVQDLAGHRSLESTQSMLDADWRAQTRVIGNLFDEIND